MNSYEENPVPLNNNDVFKLFNTNDPRQLFNEVLNKSMSLDGGSRQERKIMNEKNDFFEEDIEEPFTHLPPVQSRMSEGTQRQIPKMYPPEKVQHMQQNKNNDALRNMLGNKYYNDLVNKPIDGGGSILESVANTMSPNPPPRYDNYDNYEVVEQPKPTMSLTIGGKTYNGKIIQNKKGQILYLIGNNQAFILTPSDLKNVSKK